MIAQDCESVTDSMPWSKFSCWTEDNITDYKITMEIRKVQSSQREAESQMKRLIMFPFVYVGPLFLWSGTHLNPVLSFVKG